MLFIPRATFPALQNLPRSYFLGHHAKGLQKMKQMLSSVDLIIECRDYRVPLTSRNPLFEESLGNKQRLIVYTKRDLGVHNLGRVGREVQTDEEIIRKWHTPSEVLFIDQSAKKDIKSVLDFTKSFAASNHALTGVRMMVVGMPNVGKSSLINALRNRSLGKGKAARTGDQPGVTRKVSSSIKIIEESKDGGKNGDEYHDAVYLVDTPGVFVPFIPDAESMLKLALCGSVKDSVIPYGTLADYCLYRINLHNPAVYSQYHVPTNNVQDLLDAIARTTGRLQKGGTPDLEATALWFLQQWRTGKLGRFVLDDVTEDGLDARKWADEHRGPSLNQAIRLAKEARKARDSMME